MAVFAVSLMTIEEARTIRITMARNLHNVLYIWANASLVWAFMMQLILGRQDPNEKVPRHYVGLDRSALNVEHPITFFLVAIAAPKPARFSFLDIFPEAFWQSLFSHDASAIA